MTPIFVDTHVIIWLRQGKLSNLSKHALRKIQHADALYYSPIVKLELTFLHEIGRLKHASDEMLEALEGIDIIMSNTPLRDLCYAAESIGWTRDIFDRLIVGEAMAANGQLITADTHIQKYFKGALW